MGSHLLLAFGLMLFITGHSVLGQAQITVTYIGQQFFPISSNATLVCMFEPTPTNLDELDVFWSRNSNGGSTKLAVSSTVPNASYVYQNAPQDIRDRFFTSYQGFGQGMASATINNIGISDETTYECEVENTIQHTAKRQSFIINVYQTPRVYIEDVEVDLDMRPPTEQMSSGTTEPPMVAENSTGSATNATEEVPTESAVAAETSSVPGDDKVTIAVCQVVNAYPEPSKIEFTAAQTGNIWTINRSDFDQISTNGDGTFNASARLRIEPISVLDGARISCATFVTSENMAVNSENESSPITVKHITSYVDIDISPSSIVQENTEVTISCRADGNPAPVKQLMIPSGTTIDVTTSPYRVTVTRSNAGMYTCLAGNDDNAEQATSSRNLQVQWIDPADIIGPSEVMQGANVELDCSSQSNAGISFEWTKDGSVIGSTKVLTLTSVVKSDSGVYTCTARGVSTTSGQHQLTVKSSCVATLTPSVSSSKTQANAAYVRLVCTADGNPGCSMSISPMLENAQSTGEDNRIEVVISELEKQMSALTFTCTASNAFSSSSVNTTLDSEPVCCATAAQGGIGVGAIILIIILVALVVVVIPVGYYCFKKRNMSKKSNEKSPASAEEEGKLTTADPDAESSI